MRLEEQGTMSKASQMILDLHFIETALKDVEPLSPLEAAEHAACDALAMEESEIKADTDTDVKWFTYTKNTGEQLAADLFKKHYGEKPEQVFMAYGLIFCGPIDV
jgi:hypothetical protein